MSRVAILTAILALSITVAGLSGSTLNAREGVATAAFSTGSTAVVVAGEFPWQQRGH